MSDQKHVKVLARTLGAAADSLDEVATDDETRAKLWDGLSATQRKALDELVACGKRREREADDAPPPKKARKELSARDRLRIIGAQLRADGASPPASAEAWDGLLARLQEVDRITAEDPVLRAQLGLKALIPPREPLFMDILPGLRNSEGKFFLRLSRNDPGPRFENQFEKGYRDYEVELVQPAQPSAVEKAVAELARDLVEKYSQWRVHRREKRAA
jgi:hypothetical protein